MTLILWHISCHLILVCTVFYPMLRVLVIKGIYFYYFKQYGIDIFNSHVRYLDYKAKFGAKKIGLIVLNSCNNELTVARKLLDLLKNGIWDSKRNKFEDLSGSILGQ